jgi:hypothetical protein
MLQPVVMRVNGVYTEIPIGGTADVTDGVCASMVSLGQAAVLVNPPDPVPVEGKKGAIK